MKRIYFLALLFALGFFFSCTNTTKKEFSADELHSEIEKGNFSAVSQQIDSILLNGNVSDSARYALVFLKDSLHRVALDFSRRKSEIVAWIEKNQGFTPSDSLLDAWEKTKSLEFRVIDGEKRYFQNAAPNIFRVDSGARALSQKAKPRSDSPRTMLFASEFKQMRPGKIPGQFLLPSKTMLLHFTLTVDADAVPAGKTVKAWLPFPRKDIRRQTDVELVATSQPDYRLSDDKTVHTSIYMEKTAEAGKPTVFSADYEIVSQGEWFDLSVIKIDPYDKESEIFKTYTAERIPHLQFSERIRTLTDKVVENAENPVEILQRCYRYIATNYPWASALEYSTIADIPQYVVENRKGDCGQVALLLIDMLRYKGIPARWQSGWMLHPGEVNLHDWAEVYFEGVGWVPVDVSFGRGDSIPAKPGRELFMSGIDSYRLYVNSDYSGTYSPEKKYPRSDTVDFQRGEVETDTENLFYDRWDYDMEVKYAK
jgi:transglutaminase-like putative cysteine protease